MGKLNDKVALVTGAASGLGEACAHRLAQEGAHVIVADVNEMLGRQVAGDIGERAEFTHLDVRLESAWQQCIAGVLDRHGRLDILVNNAGVLLAATIEDTTVEQLDLIRSVNFDGPFLGCKHAIPAMADGGGGAIVNISSAASLMGTPAYAAYSCTKGAVRALTQTVAVHCKQRGNGIRCNSIHPGGMDTPMVRNIGEGEVSALAMEMTTVGKTMDRMGVPADVAAAVAYLASDEAGFVNGAALSVDDGMTVGGYALG